MWPIEQLYIELGLFTRQIPNRSQNSISFSFPVRRMPLHLFTYNVGLSWCELNASFRTDIAQRALLWHPSFTIATLIMGMAYLIHVLIKSHLHSSEVEY